MWTWYADRGAGLVAYAALWLAVLTGILYNAKGFGILHRASRRIHVPTSVVASVTVLAHVAFGLVDAWLLLRREVPHPPYTDAFFAAGLLVGAAALLLTVTAILGFVDARRFERPWDPRAVHAFAYAGFAFSTVHAAAIGTDILQVVWPGLTAASAFLLYVLVLRFLEERHATAKPVPRGP